MRRVACLVVVAACGRVNFGYPLVPCEDVVSGTSTLWSENDHCYSRHDITTTRQGGSAACASIGGHLATITSPDENEAIRAGLALEREVRIGLSTGVAGGASWTWGTGEPAPYANWPDAGPVPCTTQGGSAILSPDGSWGSICADDPVNFACEIEPWLVRDDGHAYRIHWTNGSWFNASAECEAMDSHLAVINSFDELAFVASVVPGDLWIGASGNAGVFTWVTGEPFGGFAPWYASSPDDPGVACVALLGTELSWSDVSCNDPYFSLCEREP